MESDELEGCSNGAELIKKKAKSLDNSLPFDVHRWSDYPEVNNAVDQIYFEIQAKSILATREHSVKKKHVKVLVLDLYVKYLIDPTMHIGVKRGKSDYDSKSRYNELHISNLTPKVVDALDQLGYLESHNGHFDRSGQRSSHISRIRATEKLVELIVNKHNIVPSMIRTSADRECIILRKYDTNKKKQVDTEYEDTPLTLSMRGKVNAYNKLIEQTFIDIPNLPPTGIPSRSGKKKSKVDVTHKFTRRIFDNGSWMQGGRFYGPWWQTIRKDWRPKLRIDGQPIVEVDYSGLHIVLLYAKKGYDYWQSVGQDPYILPSYANPAKLDDGELRELLKLVLLISVNAKDRKNGLDAIRKELNFNKDIYCWWDPKVIDLELIVDEFLKKHRAIKDYFFSNAGIELQYIDSLIAERIMDWFTAKNVPCLIIHDSFIVPFSVEGELRQKMDDFCQQVIAEKLNEGRITVDMKKKPRKQPWHVFPSEDGEKISQNSVQLDGNKAMEQLLEEIYPRYKKRKKQHHSLISQRTREIPIIASDSHSTNPP